MDLDIAIINAALYIGVFLIYWTKHKELNLFSVILMAYVLVAVFGCIIIYVNIDSYNLSVFNFIYLFACTLIFIWPFRYARFSKSNITIVDNRALNILLIIYFLAGSISLVYSIPRTIALAQMDDWEKVRNVVYNDADSIEYYGSQFERLAKNIYSYLSPFGMVMIFYQFTKKKINYIFTLALLFVWAANTYCNSTVVASRGMVVFIALNMVLVFLIFRKSIPKQRKKYIYIAGLCVAIVFTTYFLAVSESRFKDNSNDMALWYLGQSMNVFNQDIMTPMHDYAYGKYFFKYFCPWLGINPDINFDALGATHGVQFMTFIGCFYIDFGPIGTILIGLLMNYILTKFTRKSHYYLSDLIVIAYYANWYINGVLVVGRSQSLGWLMMFVVYFIVRTIETRGSSTRKLRKHSTNYIKDSHPYSQE